MKKYELIIFDCDGTLVDSEPVTNRVVAAMINELGIKISLEETLMRFAGKTVMAITHFVKQTIIDLDEVAFEKEYRARSLKLLNEELKPIKGVKDLLDGLDIPFCVASNGPKMKMDVTLPASGLDQYFHGRNTFSAYEIEVWKPAPALFHYAAKNMGISPNKTLVIEDTWSGVMAAVNGNIDVWAFNQHLDKRLHLHGVPNFKYMSSIQDCLTRYL